MAETNASVGYGSTFAIKTAGVYALLAEVTNIGGLGLERETQDATHLSSPDRYREVIAGLRKAKSVTLTINYVPGGADETALLAAYALDVKNDFQVTFPNTAKWQFRGYMTDFAIGDLTPDGKMEATATFEQSGKPTRVAVGG